MRSTATIRCPFCPFAARHTDDTPHEVCDFLKRVIYRHFSEQHPEHEDAAKVAEPIVDAMLAQLAGRAG